MREIKFRAWSDNHKKMATPFMILHHNEVIEYPSTHWSDLDYSNISYCHLMQYTGLKDKSGVEIYEGDIVNTTSLFLEGPENREVYFEHNYWAVKDYKGAYTGLNMPDNERYGVEVIGNIYENPELLSE